MLNNQTSTTTTKKIIKETQIINNYYYLLSTPLNNNNNNNEINYKEKEDNNKLSTISSTSSISSIHSTYSPNLTLFTYNSINNNNNNRNYNQPHSCCNNNNNNTSLNINRKQNNNNKCSSYLKDFQSYFYTNTKFSLIKNKFIMSYEEQLHKALIKGNLELCKELVIKYNCDLNLIVYRRLPLALACEYNYYDLVKLFLKYGANLNQNDFFDQTCLLYAINSADLNIIQLLVENGSNVNQCDSNGIYPIHLAIFRKNDEICNYLLDSGALINITDKQGTSPLSLAISNEYVYMIHKLIDSGANVNQSDTNGDSPLIKCIWSTNIDTNELIEIINKILKKGANINYRNKTGRSALYTAIYQNNTRVALYLMEHGAECHNCSLLMGNFTLLHYACFQGNYTLTKALIEKKCNVNATSDNNETPIYIATTKGHVDLIELLIKYNANVNIFAGSESDNKCTPLQAAVYYISSYELFKSIVDALIMGNVDLSIDLPGPILILCLQYNKYNFAKYLISNGALINQRSIFNQSCLYKAFLSRNLEFLSMCINAGYNLRDDEWIKEYIENPKFIDYPEYYLQQIRFKSQISASNTDTLEAADQNEIARLLDEEEYFSRRYRNLNRCSFNQSIKNDIYELIKYYYKNPLSLKQLSRIKIRNLLLKNDYKIRFKVMNNLKTQLPQRLLDYLLFNEFLTP